MGLKLYAHWITINYREAYGIHASNEFYLIMKVPEEEKLCYEKITIGLSKIDEGIIDCLYVGNLDAKRDWGHAKEYVEIQWKILQKDKPDDYVIATGRQESVRKFIELSAKELGWKGIAWVGKGLNEIGKRIDTDQTVIRVEKIFSDLQKLIIC